MVSRLKAIALSAAVHSGMVERVAASRWRTHRLLILCYHGVSLSDEHKWRPALYVTASRLAERFEFLARGGYRVLRLGDALDRMYSGTLPSRSVVLTFDDGGHDFHVSALPLLRHYGYPATVYLRTDYCGQPFPVFLLMLSYLMWKAGPVVTMIRSSNAQIGIDTMTEAGRNASARRVASHVRRLHLSTMQRDELLSLLCDGLEIDYKRLHDQRLLQIMAPDEVKEAAQAGVDIQLHTHNHFSPRAQVEYREQLRLNRAVIHNIIGTVPRHFCYPSGEHAPEFLAWLEAEAVESATTCVPGLASRKSRPLLLPRFIDTMQRTPDEFSAWLGGAGALISRWPKYLA